MGVFKKVASKSLDQGSNLEGLPSPNSSDPEERKLFPQGNSAFLLQNPEIFKKTADTGSKN